MKAVDREEIYSIYFEATDIGTQIKVSDGICLMSGLGFLIQD